MNTHNQHYPIYNPASLYVEPAAGMHHFVTRNKMSHLFKSPTPFLSTGNFDSLPPQIQNSPGHKHMSCGNFMTSTKAEDWSQVPDEFKVSRFNTDALTHSPQNVKYNIGSEENFQYPRRSGNNRPRSHEEIDDFPELSASNRGQNRPTRPAHQHPQQQTGKATSGYKPSGFYQPNNGPAHKVIAKPVQKDSSEEDDSANEYELRSDDEEDNRGGQPNMDDQFNQSVNYTSQVSKMEDVFDNLKDKCLAQLLNKKANRRLNQSAIVNEEEIEQDEFYSPAQLLDMSLQSKESSVKVQAYIKTLNSQGLNQVAHYLCSNINYLITDKFGNYVVQFLVEIHQPSRNYVSDLCLKNYNKFAENEYGSRIMQKLASISPQFCSMALELFYKSFDHLIKNITGSILLSKLISCSQNEAEYRFCVHILEKNKDYLRKAYFNRMLATLVSCCSQTLLSHTVYCMKTHIWVLMNDKFGNYVLQIVVERGEQEGSKLIKQACLKNYTVILTRKYPKFLLIKMIEMEKNTDFCSRLMGSIIIMDDSSIWNILSKKDSAMLMTLLVSKQRSDLIEHCADKILKLLSSSQARALPHYQELFDGITKVKDAATDTDQISTYKFSLPNKEHFPSLKH